LDRSIDPNYSAVSIYYNKYQTYQQNLAQAFDAVVEEYRDKLFNQVSNMYFMKSKTNGIYVIDIPSEPYDSDRINSVININSWFFIFLKNLNLIDGEILTNYFQTDLELDQTEADIM